MKRLWILALGLTLSSAALAETVSIVNTTGERVVFELANDPEFTRPVIASLVNCRYRDLSKCQGYEGFRLSQKTVYIRFANLSMYSPETKVYGLQAGGVYQFDQLRGPSNLVGIGLITLKK